MRVLQVIPYFTPARGGDVNVCYNISKYLAKSGHEVTILTTDFEFSKEYANSLLNEGVEVIPLKCDFNIKFFLVSLGLSRWLDLHMANFDVIHLHTFRSYQNNIVCMYAKKYDIPYVLQANGSVLRIIEKQSLKWIYDVVWGSKILRDSRKMLAVSESEVKQYIDMGVEDNKIALIPNAIDTDRFSQLPTEGRFRRSLGISDNDKMVLYLGRLHKRKKIDVLINSFYYVQKEISNVVLVIAGQDYDQKKRLIDIIHKLDLDDKVKFAGYVEYPSEAYVDADILVYPAIYEIFGLIPFEAIMAGTAVIVSNDSGCGEFVKAANCGYLTKPADMMDLKEKIVIALNHPQENNAMANKGREYIMNNLTWNHIIRSILSVYGEVTGEMQ